MTWRMVDGESALVCPSNGYDVSVILRDRDGGQITLVLDDPEAAIRIGQEMVRVGEQVKVRRTGN